MKKNISFDESGILANKPRFRKPMTRIRKTMELDADKLRKARKILGSASDTQTVDRALEIVVANAEIEKAMDTVFGALPDFPDA